MTRQISLFPPRHSRSIRALVRERMLGFELRQKDRTAKRIARRKKHQQNEPPQQIEFWMATTKRES